MAMKNFEKQLSEGLRTHEQPNAEQVQRTVVAVQNMAAKHPPRNHRSWISFLIIQARFAGVSMWLWQILVLAALLGCMYSGALSAYPYVSLMGCSVAAITAVLPILYRTIRYQIMEIELPCYYSGAQQLAARLIFTGIGVVVTLSVAIVCAAHHTWFSLGCIVMYVLFPALLTMCGDLLLLTHAAWGKLPLYAAIWTSIVLVFLLCWHRSRIAAEFHIGYVGVFAVLLFICGVQLWNLIKKGGMVYGIAH